MKINRYFESIQGEGRYTGRPVLFIRTSGCTRNCEWCDTKYHKDGKNIDEEKLINIINDSNLNTVVWTGGEPLIQRTAIKYIIRRCGFEKRHHLETNGDLLKLEDTHLFDYISFSPKELKTLLRVEKEIGYTPNVDIKVVTDLVMNMDMVPYADYLMPLTTDHNKMNIDIERQLWKYCITQNKKFSLRQHIKVWGKEKRGI